MSVWLELSPRRRLRNNREVPVIAESKPEFEAIIAEIVDVTQICSGVLPDSMKSFWRELAIWRNISPGVDPAANARGIFDSFGEPWDEDFLEDDGSPSLAALEAAHAAIVRVKGLAAAPNLAPEEQDNEEDEEFAAEERDIAASTDTWNIQTVIAMVRDGRIILNPEWQRSFVWKPRKQKALIESLLLGLPIPSFLLYKNREEGKLYVIDGRQRLETISRFTNPKEKRGEAKIRFRTPSSSQEGWKPDQLLYPAAKKYYQDLPEKFKTQFDTRSVQVAILDVSLAHLYQIFKRYNTGSVALNAAEIRNAVFQRSKLHEMMFRLGGEHRDPSKYLDEEERQVGEDLRGIMKNKKERYGAYDFIGRFFAFKYELTGSVAKATFNFMSRETQADNSRIEQFRKEFIDAFRATTQWYEYPLTEPEPKGLFHAFLATIQMVSSSRMQELIASGATSEEKVAASVQSQWRGFAAMVQQNKQNSTNFWNYQADWIRKLEQAVK
jgi:uncharacterized protein DUF262